jgi:hypothetical protein
VKAENMYHLITPIFETNLNSNVSPCLQQIQTAIIEIIAGIADPKNSTYDTCAKEEAVSFLKKINRQMSFSDSTDRGTMAHRANLLFVINRALQMQTNRIHMNKER